MGAKYLVFHVSDVSIEEGYTYRWRHTLEEVVDGAAEVINVLFKGAEDGPDLLLENLWWPGLTRPPPARSRADGGQSSGCAGSWRRTVPRSPGAGWRGPRRCGSAHRPR